MLKREYPALQAEELAALRSFAQDYGRRWKSILRDVYWYNARIWRNPDDEWSQDGYRLHSLRNSHGPSWLDGFQFPKGA